MKQDRKLVSAKEKYEAAYIAKKWKIPVADVRKVMKEKGKKGKMARSRKVIYQGLREMGYTINTK